MRPATPAEHVSPTPFLRIILTTICDFSFHPNKSVPRSVLDAFLEAPPVAYHAPVDTAGDDGSEELDINEGGRRRRPRAGLHSIHLSRLR